MESKVSLREKPAPSSKGRGANSLGNGSPLLDTPKRARRQKARSSPRVEETPERVTGKSMTTRSSRENPRLAKALNGGSTDAACLSTLLQTPPLPSSPLSPFVKAGLSPDSVSKPRKSSFREKFVYLTGTNSYVDMTSIPTKDTVRLAIWVIQQLSHFIEHIELEGTPFGDHTTRSVQVQPAQSEPLSIDSPSGHVHQASGPRLSQDLSTEPYKSPSPPKTEEPNTDSTPVTESRRQGLRPRKLAKRVRYDDEVGHSVLHGSDEEHDELAAAGDSSQMKASSHGKVSGALPSEAAGAIAGEALCTQRSVASKTDSRTVSKERWNERPRTLSQKEIYRRNWAVEHDVMPGLFKLPENALNFLFPPNDNTIFQNTSDLGAILIRVLKSVTEPTTLEEGADILRDFILIIKKSFNDKQALTQAFARLARNHVVQQSVKCYLEALGKPEEKEFGESEDIHEEEWVRERVKQFGRRRGRPAKVSNPLEPINLPAETWKTLSAFKPYSTPYPNLPLNPIAELISTSGPSKGKGKQTELPTNVSTATTSAPATHHAQNVLSESQIDNLLALATTGSASDDEDGDNEAPTSTLEDTFRDLEMSALLRRHIKEATAKQNPTKRREDWTLLPFVMTLADPNNVMTPEQRFAVSEMRFEEFAALYVHPKVNTVMPANQARALSEAYKYMAARMSGKPLLSMYEYEGGQNGAGSAGASSSTGLRGSTQGGSRRLTREQLDAIKEDIQKDYDEARAQKERGEDVVKEPKRKDGKAKK